jgi:DNA-binding NarL/FixJ family response regulator
MEKLVFIVDDDPVYLKFMKEHFKQLGGFKTEIFLQGDEAIIKIAEQKPYLVILDNHLDEPNKSGIFYLKEISKIKPRIPVIYITGDTDPELKKTVMKVGVQSYIIKDSAFLVYLRTALDDIAYPPKKGLLKKIFGS